MKYSIIIPCYNEETNINDLICRLEQLGGGYDIQWIMVENGSLDRTRLFLESACQGKSRFKIVYVDKNQGYGYGLLQGMEVAQGEYIGWIHADMQIAPSEMVRFIEIAEREPDRRLFLKGRRKGRSLLDYFFTGGMTLYASIMLKTWIYDIGAIPVLFHKSLLQTFSSVPYDFSIEAYIYARAKQAGFEIRRYMVSQNTRQKGHSSWNCGFRSKMKQSRLVIRDIALIRKGKQVR